MAILICVSLIKTMNHPRHILTNKMEEVTSYKGFVGRSNELWLTGCVSKLFLSKCVIYFEIIISCKAFSGFVFLRVITTVAVLSISIFLGVYVLLCFVCILCFFTSPIVIALVLV